MLEQKLKEILVERKCGLGFFSVGILAILEKDFSIPTTVMFTKL